MPTNFPAALDTFTDPLAASLMSTVPHSSQHANLNAAVAALQRKLGVNGSADATSVDAKLALVAGLQTSVYDVRGYGADITGAADSTAAINAALAAIPSAGGVLFFAPGTYLLGTITTVSSVYKYLIKTKANVAFLGQGAEFVTLKVKAALGSYTTVISAGGDPNGDWSGFSMHGITIDQNAANNTVPNLPDLQAMPRLALLGYVGHGVTVSNNRFINFKSINTVSFNAVPSAVYDITVSNNYFAPQAQGSIDNDHSTIYLAGARLTINGNTFVGPAAGTPGVTTAIETHGDDQTVIGNKVYNYRIGANITGVAVSSQNLTVSHNNFTDVLYGINLWSWFFGGNVSEPALKNVRISYNNIILNRDPYAASTPLSAGIALDPSGLAPTRQVSIDHNHIYFKATTQSTVFDGNNCGIFWTRNDPSSIIDEDLEISDNTIVNASANGIQVTAGVKRLRILRNLVHNCGQLTNGSVSNSYKTGIFLGPIITQEDWLVQGNQLIDDQNTATMKQGLLFLNVTAVNCQCIDNTIRTKDTGATHYALPSVTAAAWLIRDNVSQFNHQPGGFAAIGSTIREISTGKLFHQVTSPAGPDWVPSLGGGMGDRVSSFPGAGPLYRGYPLTIFGGTGVSDSIAICKKRSDDSYYWAPVGDMQLSTVLGADQVPFGSGTQFATHDDFRMVRGTSDALVLGHALPGVYWAEGAAGTTRGFQITSNFLQRWLLSGSSDAESGANVGTDLVLASFTDAGSFLNEIVRFKRAAGQAIVCTRSIDVQGVATTYLTTGGTVTGGHLKDTAALVNQIPVANAAGLFLYSDDLRYVSGTAFIVGGTAAGSVWLNGPSGTIRGLTILAGSLQCWQLYGENSGNTDLYLSSYDNTGTFRDTVLSIARAVGGHITIARPLDALAVTLTSLAATAAISTTLATDSSSTSTGAIKSSGGIGALRTISGGNLRDASATSYQVPAADSGGKFTYTDDLRFIAGTALIVGGTTAGSVWLNGSTGSTRGYAILGGGALCWQLLADSAGSSNLLLNAYDGSGVFIDTPLSIVRVASGLLTIARPTIFTSSMSRPASRKSANYTLTNNDDAVSFDTTGGSLTATLPASPSNGQLHDVYKEVAGNTLTVNGNGQNINGAGATISLTAAASSYKFRFVSGFGWIVR